MNRNTDVWLCRTTKKLNGIQTSVPAAMIRLRGQEDMERYTLLIDEQVVIGWDNLLRGKFSKQWKIQ